MEGGSDGILSSTHMSRPVCPIALAPGRALGVVIVSFRSQDVILDCLESLLATAGQPLRILMVDNASGDGTPARIRAWADGSDPAPDPVPADSVLPYDRVPHGPVPLEAVPEGGAGPRAGAVGLLELPENRGFAGGVGRGVGAVRPGADARRGAVAGGVVDHDDPQGLAPRGQKALEAIEDHVLRAEGHDHHPQGAAGGEGRDDGMGGRRTHARVPSRRRGAA